MPDPPASSSPAPRRYSIRALFNIKTPIPLKIHARTQSLIDVFIRLNPKNRPERGGTLREGIDWNDGSDSERHSHIPIPPYQPISWRHSYTTKNPGRRQLEEEDLNSKTTVENGVAKEMIKKYQDEIMARTERRAARRSFRESEDFLGIQGVNPRTGQRDISEATTSTHPSLVSEETRQKMDQQAKEISELKKAYETAQARFNVEWARYRAAKEEKKEIERRKGIVKRKAKWLVSENGWNTVLTPDLTVIDTSSGGEGAGGGYFREVIPVIPEHSIVASVDFRFGRGFTRGSSSRHRRHRRSFK
jgi:hypothetical protein